VHSLRADFVVLCEEALLTSLAISSQAQMILAAWIERDLRMACNCILPNTFSQHHEGETKSLSLNVCDKDHRPLIRKESTFSA
jgi:hypothetical protein